MINATETVAKSYKGEVEFIIRDKHGRVLQQIREPNIIKIDAKEILPHRLAHTRVWDPIGGSGDGAWVDHGIDTEEFSVKYIVFGASFDENGAPLNVADNRFYRIDSVTGTYVPVTLGVGADYDGGLINAIPITEPSSPLKRIERIYFESSYQPSGSPLLQNDVRAMNNVIVFETTLTKDEYNGFGTTSADFFTITEVALVGAREVTTTGGTPINPRDYFLTGSSNSTTGAPFLATASGTSTVALDAGEDASAIVEGDRIKLINYDGSEITDLVNPYFLVVSKAVGGRDLVLDRTPVTSNNNIDLPIAGTVGILRDGFKVFSHRILRSPVKKSADFTITARWRIAFS
jgi:hypothetical protein